jgi:hypothetical protein
MWENGRHLLRPVEGVQRFTREGQQAGRKYALEKQQPEKTNQREILLPWMTHSLLVCAIRGTVAIRSELCSISLQNWTSSHFDALQ